MTVTISNSKIGTVIVGNVKCSDVTFNVGRDGVQILSAHGQPMGATTIGSGRLATEQRSLTGNPTRLETQLGKIEVAIGPKLACEVSADDNLLQQVITKVDGDDLRIEWEGSGVLTSAITIRLTMPALERINVKGASAVTVLGALNQSELRCKVSGSGEVTAAGQVERFKARLSGAGTIDAEALRCRRADLEVSGAGNLRVFATEEAHIELSGAGSVRVLGNPQVRDVEKSGIGHISWS